MDNSINISINSLRASISEDIDEIRAIADVAKPPVVQEVILAQRALEDARMRLAVARTYQQGKDPFVES